MCARVQFRMFKIMTLVTLANLSRQSQGGRLSISERRRRSTITIQGITIRKITIQKPSTITGPRQPTGWRWCQKVSKNRARGLENGGGWGTGNGGEGQEWGRWGHLVPRKGHRNSCAGVLCLWQDPKLLKKYEYHRLAEAADSTIGKRSF